VLDLFDKHYKYKDPFSRKRRSQEPTDQGRLQGMKKKSTGSKEQIESLYEQEDFYDFDIELDKGNNVTD